MRQDQLTELLRLEVLRLMRLHGPMQQIELARRAGDTQQRVQRFLAGQMPYPPLMFLDRLFRVFGVTLADGLKGQVRPAPVLPVLRPDVQAVADVCATLDGQAVEAVMMLASTLQGAGRRGAAPAPAASAASARKRQTTAKREPR